MRGARTKEPLSKRRVGARGPLMGAVCVRLVGEPGLDEPSA
jgi:hypothetical protein